VGNDPFIRDAHDVAGLRSSGGVVLYLEAILERVFLHEDRVRHDVAVQLERLPLPLLLVPDDLVDVLVVLGALAQRAPQHSGKCEDEDERGGDQLDISMWHKDFRERNRARIPWLAARCKNCDPSPGGPLSLVRLDLLYHPQHGRDYAVAAAGVKLERMRR